MSIKLTLYLSPLEIEVLELAQSAGGFGSLEDLARVALWMQAEHMGVDVPQDCFVLPFKPELQKLLAIERAHRDGIEVEGQPSLFDESPTT